MRSRRAWSGSHPLLPHSKSLKNLVSNRNGGRQFNHPADGAHVLQRTFEQRTRRAMHEAFHFDAE